MTGRSRLVRGLALLLAALQLVSPAIGSVADGLQLSDGDRAVAHIEATTSDRCPVVHPPDCGLCRYMNNHAAVVEPPMVTFALAAVAHTDAPDIASAATREQALHLGRAPPAT